jgi:type II secretory ATPase GspE/PulE/Tfp pilus assembly ATPase PilB-like protein
MDTVSLSVRPPLPFGDRQYPIEFVEQYGAIKLSEDESSVVVGLVHPDDEVLRARLEDYHGKPIETFAVDRTELSSYLSRYLGEEEGAMAGPDDRVGIDELANDAPVVNFVNGLLLDGIRRGASDIHIEAAASRAQVRYRIDGVLSCGGEFDMGRFGAIASRIKIIANLNILERRRPQDGRITVSLEGQSIDLRTSIVPTAHGESIVLRLFNRADQRIELDQLGYEPADAEVLRSLESVSHGLVLVTGPTGSGKTTTLNAILRELDREKKKVITIEDPVEYLVDGVQQIQTNDAIGLTFDVILRRVLRQDPDVIMVGEIRDTETAELAIRSALTGHLVFATLHTNDAAGAITRLVDMGAKPYLIAAVFRAAIAQRLVRRVCSSCGKSRKATEHEIAALTEQGLKPAKLRSGDGCEVCGNSGFHGRVAIAEIIRADEELEHLILSGADRRAIASAAERAGTVPMIRDGYRKALSGLTTVEEVQRAVGA